MSAVSLGGVVDKSLPLTPCELIYRFLFELGETLDDIEELLVVDRHRRMRTARAVPSDHALRVLAIVGLLINVAVFVIKDARA